VTKWLPVIVTVLTTVGMALFTPAFVASHLTLLAVLNSIAQLLHSVLPSTLPPPAPNNTPAGRKIA
jgi:hypothetical protein